MLNIKILKKKYPQEMKLRVNLDPSKSYEEESTYIFNEKDGNLYI